MKSPTVSKATRNGGAATAAWGSRPELTKDFPSYGPAGGAGSNRSFSGVEAMVWPGGRNVTECRSGPGMRHSTVVPRAIETDWGR